MHVAPPRDIHCSRLTDVGLTAAAVVVVAVVRYFLDPFLGDTHPYILFIFPALYLANRGGWKPAFVALLVGAMVSNYLFAAPRMSLWVSSINNQIGLLIYLVVGGAGVYLADARRTAQMQTEAGAAAFASEAAAHQRTQD